MSLPKKADCIDCLRYRPVKWVTPSEPVCAECRKMRAETKFK